MDFGAQRPEGIGQSEINFPELEVRVANQESSEALGRAKYMRNHVCPSGTKSRMSELHVACSFPFFLHHLECTLMQGASRNINLIKFCTAFNQFREPIVQGVPKECRNNALHVHKGNTVCLI